MPELAYADLTTIVPKRQLSAMTFVKISLSEGRNFLNKFRVPGTGTHRLGSEPRRIGAAIDGDAADPQARRPSRRLMNCFRRPSFRRGSGLAFAARRLRLYSRSYFLLASNCSGVMVATRLRAYSHLCALSASNCSGVMVATRLRAYSHLCALCASVWSGLP